MGYDTQFFGYITVEPPLSPDQVDFLKRFAATRHCEHKPSPYTADGTYGCDGRSCSKAGPGVPGFWCKWEATDNGAEIRWNGEEKFYDSEEWMRFIIDHFLKPDPDVHGVFIPVINGEASTDAHRLFGFDGGHTLNGSIEAQGEEMDDRWWLLVEGNVVTVKTLEELMPKPAVKKPAVVQGSVVDERPVPRT